MVNRTRIAVSGATGFIGKSVCSFLEEQGCVVVRITREDFSQGPEWLVRKISGCNGIVNLAGSPVIRRWTPSGKRIILESRVATTRLIGEAIRKMPEKPELFINASATGIYDDKNIHDEESRGFDEGFLGTVVSEWEKTAMQFKEYANRIVLLRIGIVIGEEGGVMKQMKWIFKMGLGGYIGDGRQAMSFIHIHDLVRSVEFIIREKGIGGIVNAVAPETTNNKEFSRNLAHRYGWKHLFAIPGLVLKILYGEAANTILIGQGAVPVKLKAHGFRFDYPSISLAVQILRK